jgi:hypothetical protein
MEDLKMSQKFDYSFFEDSLHKLRKLRAYSIDKSYLLKAPAQIFPDLELGIAPKVLEGTDADSSQVILTKSFARKRPQKLDRLEQKIKGSLPDDFRQFHEIYDEALIVTRTMPIKIFTESAILEEIEMWRDCFDKPLRFFRFGVYWYYGNRYFGLWKPNENSNEWSVVYTSHNHRDDDFDASDFDMEDIVSSSFYKWLKILIETDGIPDPLMEIGPEGGFLDPV